MEQTFKRDIRSLEDIFAFIGRATFPRSVPDSVTFSINLAVEEIFTNMVKYNTSNNDEISISLVIDGKRAVIQLVDVDVDPFDPATREAVVLDKPLEDREIGGLGLHLVKSIVDKVAYEYQDRQMKVTVTKNLER
jgi:anti-sigma regulatory factor (Ser/Thr protein kinase)